MQLIKNRVLLAKVESTIGTDSVPVVGTNAIDVKNVKWGAPGEELTRDVYRGSISPLASVIGKVYQEVSFDCELKNGGTAGTVNQLTDLLKACCLSETITAGSSVVYLPTSSNQKTVTIYIYDLDSGSAVLKKLTGAVGNVSLKLTAGNFGVLSFSFKGLYNAPADVALPSTPTFEATTPPIIQSALYSINSVSGLVVKDITLDLKNVIAERDDVNSPYGIKSFFVSGRKPEGSSPAESVLCGAWGRFADFVASAQRTMTITIGSTAGNQIVITAPKLVLTKIANSDNGGVLTDDLSFMLGQNAGNDEISIKFL